MGWGVRVRAEESEGGARRRWKVLDTGYFCRLFSDEPTWTRYVFDDSTKDEILSQGVQSTLRLSMGRTGQRLVQGRQRLVPGYPKE